MTEPADDPAPDLAFSARVEEPEPWRRVIRVEVPRAAFEQEYARLLQSARRRAVRPGFRPGRVPKAVVEREMRPELQVKAVEPVIEQAYRETVTAHEWIPLGDPRVGEFQFDQSGQPISFQISVEVRPHITVSGYDGLPLRRRAAKAADADVDGVVQRLREARGVTEAVDRPAQAGDELALDIVPLDEAGAPEESRRVPDYAFTIGEPDNIVAFDEQLAGVRAGELREVRVTYGADHGNERLRGRAVTYRVAVKGVQHKLLPDADDAFAAAVKPGETLLGLRTAIRADLVRQDEETVRRELEEQIVDGLLERNEIPVPPSLLEQYLKAGLDDLHAQNARRSRVAAPDEDARYRELTRPVAERVIRTIFLLEAVRRQERIEIGGEDIDRRIDEIAREFDFDPEKYRAYANQGAERERIGRALEERRTFDFLLSRAAIGDAPEPASDSA